MSATSPTAVPTPSPSPPPSTTFSARYTAPCSVPLSAALSIIVSRADVTAAPNPFRCDFAAAIAFVLCTLNTNDLEFADALITDPRTYSYLTLAAYRLMRHLIPSHDDIVACSAQIGDTAPPTTPPEQKDMKSTEQRVRALFTGELQSNALKECNKFMRKKQSSSRPDMIFTVDGVMAPLLSIDAASDETDLSVWQRWMIGSRIWQRCAAAAMEYMVAEILELLGNAVRNQQCEGGTISAIHQFVLEQDDELMALWLIIGMPAHCPSTADTDIREAYTQQFQAQMRAAVATSAPWMFDVEQMEHRVSDWASGRLPSGDALFFRRYHIRPLWHAGVNHSDYICTKRWEEENEDGYDSNTDREYDEMYRKGQTDGFVGMKAGFDLVDAAGVSYPLIIECRVARDTDRPKQRDLVVSISGGGEEWDERVMWSEVAVGGVSERAGEHDDSCEWIHLLFEENLWNPNEHQQEPNPLVNYVCHGHLHGLSEQQWEEAMGGRVSVNYHYSADPENEQEKKYDAQAAVSKEGMFPARLADVVDREQYRYLQKAEIRRMAALATRLALLDEGVDAAIFPCFQPAEVRQRFEAVVQSAMETEVAGLPAPLPAVLQRMVAEYASTRVDIPV